MYRLILLLAMVFVLGCSQTELVSSWRIKKPVGYQRLMTVGISKNVGTRRIFEDALVDQAAKHGFKAYPSYPYMPEPGKLDQAQLAKAIEQAQADAVLIMRLVSVDRRMGWTPGYYQPAPAPRFGFYDEAWGSYYDPPDPYEEVTIVLETNVYDTKTAELVWTGRTRTIDPLNLSREMDEVGVIIVDALVKDGVVRVVKP